MIQELLSKLESHGEEIENILATLKQQNSATFVWADTGVGKSTFINYLTGRPLKVIEKPHEPNSYLIEEAGSSSLKIGHDKSTTKIPAVVATKEGDILVDTAGSYDTQGFKADLVNGLILKKIFNEVENKKIIMVLNANSFDANRGELLKRNFKRLNNFFGKKYTKILFVISKAKMGVDYKSMLTKIIKEDDSLYIFKNKKFLLKILDSSYILPFYQPDSSDYEASKKQELWDVEQRIDRNNILEILKILKPLKVKHMSLTFDGENARTIEQLRTELKQKTKKELESVSD